MKPVSVNHLDKTQTRELLTIKIDIYVSQSQQMRKMTFER